MLHKITAPVPLLMCAFGGALMLAVSAMLNRPQIIVEPAAAVISVTVPQPDVVILPMLSPVLVPIPRPAPNRR